MKFKQDTGIQQARKQKMTPALIQSLNMLGLSAYEIHEMVTRELNENPVLEATGWDRGRESISDILEKTVAQERSLSAHLMEQALLCSQNDDEYRLLEYLISLLDTNGFLTIKPEIAAEELKRDSEEVKRALKIINGFDPAGCGTAGSRESLMVQAGEYYPGDLLLRVILENYLEELGKGEYGKIAGSLKITEETVREKRDLIRGLEPFPGKNYSPVRKEYIIPDIRAWIEKGRVRVELNGTGVPELTINPFYSKMAKRKTGGDEKEYLREKIESAKNLINTIKRRGETLLNIAEEILDYQKDFILSGPGKLLPLLQKDVAKRTGLHESTISRIVNNKYVDYPGGIVPLKIFFTRSISTAGTGTGRISTELIRIKISEIVRNEDRRAPLKDDEIAGELRRSGLDISRRTVSKYRGILGIETAGRRKKGPGSGNLPHNP